MPGKKQEKEVRGRQQDDFLRLIAGLVPQKSNQLVRLVEGIRADSRRRAIARAEARTAGRDIEASYGYPLPAQAAYRGQARLVHSQHESWDPGIEGFSSGCRKERLAGSPRQRDARGREMQPAFIGHDRAPPPEDKRSLGQDLPGAMTQPAQSLPADPDPGIALEEARR